MTDWVKGYRVISGVIGNAFCLSDNTPMITAIANDIGYSEIYSYQLQSYAKSDDLLVCVTGSGESKNVVRACETAKELGLKVVGLTGYSGGQTAKMADYNFHCAVEDMQIVEDMHISFGHMVIRCANNFS